MMKCYENLLCYLYNAEMFIFIFFSDEPTKYMSLVEALGISLGFSLFGILVIVGMALLIYNNKKTQNGEIIFITAEVTKSDSPSV